LPVRQGRSEIARFPGDLPPTPASHCVSPIVRRAARSCVRLTDRAFVLKERASDTCSSLS
jgi:hypothetical protein